MPERAVDGRLSPVDERLLDLVRAATDGMSRMVVLVGDPMLSVRAGQDVLARIAGPWRQIWTPRGPAELVDGLSGSRQVTPWTVVWLEDLARFVLPADPELAATVASLLRGLLIDERVTPTLVLSTLAPDVEVWRRLTRPSASGGTTAFAQAQALLRRATFLSVGAPVPHPVPQPAQPQPAQPQPAQPQAREAASPAAVAEPVVVEPAAPTADEPVGAPTVAKPMIESRADVETETQTTETPSAETPTVETPTVETPTVETPEEPSTDREPDSGAEFDVAAPWTPTPFPVDVPEPPDAARWRAMLRESAGDVSGAERLYERAAIGGDLDALARLGRLRDVAGEVGSEVADAFIDEAVAKGNTAVLFTLAAAGHPRALEELARLLEQTDRSHPPSDN